MRAKVVALCAVVCAGLICLFIGSRVRSRAQVDRLASDALDAVQNAEAFERWDAASFGAADLRAREAIQVLSRNAQARGRHAAVACVSAYLSGVERERLAFEIESASNGEVQENGAPDLIGAARGCLEAARSRP